MRSATTRITKSFDNGRTWANPKDIEFDSADIIVPSKIKKMPDGSIGFPCEMHDHWEGGYKEGNYGRFIKSYDRGETFPDGIFYGDARHVFTNSGTMIFLWTLDLSKMADRPIHFISTVDNAKSWSEPIPTDIPTQIMSPLYIRDGLMIGYPSGQVFGETRAQGSAWP